MMQHKTHFVHITERRYNGFITATDEYDWRGSNGSIIYKYDQDIVRIMLHYIRCNDKNAVNLLDDNSGIIEVLKKRVSYEHFMLQLDLGFIFINEQQHDTYTKFV